MTAGELGASRSDGLKYTQPLHGTGGLRFGALMNQRSFFPSVRSGLLAGVVVSGLLLSGFAAASVAQDAAPAAATQDPAPAPAAAEAPAATAATPAQNDPTLNALPPNGSKAIKESRKERKADKVVQLKDTRKLAKKDKKVDPLVGKDVNLPDKQLYDKALLATKSGHFDVARLDLQTLLNTYQDSQYQMRAKLAIADSWYREGGTAALTQAEQEYADFRVFFPNTPEAAEAQMRIGDIYFRQMDKPDRDYSKAVHAEEEYRRMLTDYPDSTLVPQAKQRLREVQEMLASREADIAAFYATHLNWSATIARYQTVIDTYPEYSHVDDVLIGLGDAYEAQARMVRAQQMAEGPKARLEKDFDDRASAAYRRVVLEHAAAPHVEDAKDRLAAMNLPIPTPTPEQMQTSMALENSRSQYRLQDRAKLLFLHQPDVVLAARIGEPSLADPKATLAPQVSKQIMADYKDAFNPGAAAHTNDAAIAPAATQPADTATVAPASPASPAAPLAFQDIPNAGQPDTTVQPVVTPTTTAPAGTGTGLGVEILSPGATANGGDASAGPPATTPGATGNALVNGASGGLKTVGPTDASTLPPVEQVGAAPDTVNDVNGVKTPAAAAAPANGKKAKSDYDKSDESSSKHKKKKGLDKINPF